MGDRLSMSVRERDRLEEMSRVRRGETSLVSSAVRLGLSYRQVKRLWKRYRARGAAGLVHAARGRASNRRRPEGVRERSLELYRERLEGFGPTLASEKLAEWGHEVDHETLRRWLQASGLWQVERRRLRHRQRRVRRERFGEMVQLDGSFHDWFRRETGQRDCLLSMIDDATGHRESLLAEEETTADAMRLLWRWIERHGIPGAIYLDRKTVYVTDREPTLAEQLAGLEPRTAFGEVCRTLGIEIIPAYSPQAKGRVERSHRVYQDRLVKEIRLQSLTSREEVNAMLDGFDENLNRRFAVPPVSAEDGHRKVRKGVDLAAVFAWQHERVVQNDWTVRFENRWLQILPSPGRRASLPAAKAKVQIQQRLDGSLHLLYRGRALPFQELTQRPARVAVTPKPAVPARPPATAWRPADDHPWKQPLTVRAARASKLQWNAGALRVSVGP